MITVHRKYLVCDTPGCRNDFALSGRILADARDWGWRRRKGPDGHMQDLCPDCAEKWWEAAQKSKGEPQ
jgi:hypothetical protein